jgi:hypothetical protein
MIRLQHCKSLPKNSSELKISGDLATTNIAEFNFETNFDNDPKKLERHSSDTNIEVRRRTYLGKRTMSPAKSGGEEILI